MALAFAFASVLAALLLAAALKRFQIGDSGTFIALLLLPLLVWGLASGKIREFSAPGGWVLKFQEVAREDVKTLPLTGTFENVQMIEKGGVGAINDLLRAATPGKPVALVLRLDRPGYYQPFAIAQYLRAFSSVDPELTVVVTNESGQFVAMADGRSIISFLGESELNPESEAQLRDALDTGSTEKLLQIPGFTTASIESTATNAQALEKLDKLARRSLVVLNEKNEPIGLAKRDAIVTHLLVQLTSDPAI